MSKKPFWEPLYSALKDLVKWFKQSGCQGIIIGGVAVSFLARPRTTQDIDVLASLDEESWPEFLALGKRFGFKARYKDTLEFARRNKVLLMRHQATLTDIDISFAALPFEKESFKRARKFRIANLTISLPSPEDLIIMKAVAHRQIDLEDIRSILEVNPDVDVKRIRCWVKEFAKVLEMPEIWDDLKKLLLKVINYRGK